jgi:hypothetical protein
LCWTLEKVEGIALAAMQKAVTISKGLHALVYDSAADISAPPTAHVSLDPGSSKSVTLISEPGASESLLDRPGACLVIRATEQAQIRIEITPARRDGSTAAVIKLHNLSSPSGTIAPNSLPPREAATPQGKAPVPPAKLTPIQDTPRSRQTSKKLNFADLRLIAHVAGKGDVSAKAGEWVATPPAGGRIEGFAVGWRVKPDDLELRYAVRMGGGNPGLTNLVTSGAFVGVRGRAMPVVGLIMQLSGPAASDYRVTVEAVFDGSPEFSAAGQQVVLSGPTGQEPLINLRLSLEKVRPGRDALAGRPARIKVKRPSSGVKKSRRAARHKSARTRR